MERSPAQAEADEDRVVLGLLLNAYPALLSLEEIVREVGDRLVAEDAVSRLVRAGLLHRLGTFVFASRAAVRAMDLAD